MEVLSPSGVPLSCTVPDLTYSYSSHTQDGLVACGETRCSILTTSSSPIRPSSSSEGPLLPGATWNTTSSHPNIPEKRRKHHVSWSSPAGLLLMGGYYYNEYTQDNDYRYAATTELIINGISSSSASFQLEYDTL